MIIKSESKVKNGLYLVSTPIGNLKDITLRAIEILKLSNFILCEDTRVSKNLLNKYEIKSKLISNYKFNEKKNVSWVMDILKSGKIVSLISDAGTPNISDPGAVLVNECIKHNINIIPIPGVSAVTAAVSISGFSEKFFFYGFFPEKNKILENDLSKLSELESAIVFFISSKKINKIIPFLKKYFIDRKILLCREISKMYEEFIRSDVKNLELLNSNLRGELTIVISEKKNEKKFLSKLTESDKINIQKMINKISIKEIVNVINQSNPVAKKEIYNYCLKLKNGN